MNTDFITLAQGAKKASVKAQGLSSDVKNSALIAVANALEANKTQIFEANKKDLEYAEVEKSQGEDVQVNIKVAGIYNLIFDVKTKTFDLDYVSAITTPVYETIEKCEIGYLDSNKEMQYVAMQKQGDELCVKNVHFAVGKGVGFYSAFTHVSWYKTTMDASCANQLIFKRGTKPNSDIYFMVGGTYNLYLNPETYVVRAELVSADADGYSAYVILDENLDVLDEPAQLSLNDNAINYQFKFQCVAENFQTYSFRWTKSRPFTIVLSNPIV